MVYSRQMIYKLCKHATSIGAKTAGYICGSNPEGNACSSPSKEAIETYFSDAGIELVYYCEVNTAAPTYETDLENCINQMASHGPSENGKYGVDLLTIKDYDQVCTDAAQQAVDINWTPNGMYLVVCNANPDVVTAMGST